MKKWKILVSLSLGLVLVTGCGNNNTEEAGSESTASSSIKKVKDSSTKESTEESEVEKSTDSADWSMIEKDLKEQTEAERVSELYQSTQSLVSEKDAVKVTIEGYRYYQIENFSRNMKIPFGDQREKGGVVIVDALIENGSVQKVYAGTGFSMSVTGFDASIMRKKQLLTEDLDSKLYEADHEIAPKSQVRGYIALSLKPEAMDKLAEHGEAMIEIPGIYSKKDSYSSADALLEKKEESIPFTVDGEKKVEAAGEFYPDKVTAENMGTKTLLTSKKLNETKDFEGIKVTLGGYQFTEFVPNEDEAPRFKNFEKGIVLLTAEVTVDNQGQETLKFANTSGGLTIDNSVKTLTQNGLEVRPKKEELAVGEKATKYLVFTLDKESYEKLYHEQEFKLDVKLYDEKFAQMTDLDDITFEFKN